MRFFQPLSQYGFSRVLAETKTRTHLSPGIISIEKPDNFKGYSAFFDITIPPDYSELKDNFDLFWMIPQSKKEKALSSRFSVPFHPFYNSDVNAELAEKDFEDYTKKFLLLDNIHEQIYSLPINFIESSVWNPILETDISLISVIGLNRIFNNQRKLSEILISLKEKLSPDIAIYLPGPISPAHFSFLVYMGIDFFDNSLAYNISKKGYFVLHDRIYPLNNHPRCYCPYCAQEDTNLFSHNELVMKNEISKIRFALEEGTLRELVEKDIHRSVTFAATLKHLDKNYNDLFRQKMPMISSSKLSCIGEESLYNPIISEYRERIRTRFNPSHEKKIVLLLPCSARKPYSFSRSHMQFRNAIKKSGKGVFSMLSEIIVTSPLSVVPRELEGIYPTKFYDIPVSGTWSEEEIAITAELLLDVLAHYSEDTVIINHMHGHGYDNIIEIIKSKQPLRVIDTAKENPPTNFESLNRLSEVLKAVVEDVDKEKAWSLPQKIRSLQATADYQYGRGAGEILFSRDMKIKGKYPRDLHLFRDKQNIATLSSKTGFLSVLPHIAQEIIDLAFNKLEFGAENVSGSNIYAPGCTHANDTIHPNDEIFIIYDNKVIATARALVSGRDMNKMTSGSLAEVKKKVKVRK